MILLFKMTPKHSVEVLTTLSKAEMYLMQKIYVLYNLCSGINYMLLAINSMLMNQQKILKKVPLNRNT